MENFCSGCPLDGTTEPMGMYGPDSAKYLVVTAVPSEASARANRLLSKGAMTVLSRVLSDAGFTQNDFAFTPAIRCAHNPDEYTTKQKKEIALRCRNYLLDDIDAVKPDAIIPLGAEAAKQTLNKAVKITKIRGQAAYVPDLHSYVLPMVNPSQCVMYPQHEPILRADAMSLGRLVEHGFDTAAASDAILGDYEFIDDLQFLVDAAPETLAFDTENTGLQWFQQGDDVREYDPRIHGAEYRPAAAVLTMQFCVKPGKAYMLVWDHPEAPMSLRRQAKVRKQLRQLLNNPRTKVVGQNAKYDRVYVANVVGVDYPIGGDTLMLGTLIDENAMEKNQDVLVKRYVPSKAGYADRFNSEVDKSRMWEVPLAKLLDYGAGDAETCLMLYEAIYPIVAEDKKLLAHYRYVSLPGLNTFSYVESRGLLVDYAALDRFQVHMQEHVANLYKELIDQVPKAIKRKHIAVAEEKAGGKAVDLRKVLSFGRGDFVRDVLFHHPSGFRLKPQVFTKTTAKLGKEHQIASTSSKDHLPFFFDKCPFTITLAQYVKDERLLGTSVLRFRENYITDGYVRPTYSLTTAVTGRTSSYSPNGQNFPKRGANAKAYRRMFVAPPGYLVLEADLSQAELRIAAESANEPTMLRVYREGGDIHTETALITMGVSMEEFRRLPKEEQKSARQKAKAVNFGFIYGMGWRKFIGYAKTQYGVTFTELEAQNIRINYFEKYSRLSVWHAATRDFANKHGYVRSFDGRIRHLPMIYSDEEGVRREAERQAVNSPIQGFASDLGVMAMARLTRDIDPQYLAPIAFVHDAIYCYVREEYVEWGAKTLKWYMQSTPLDKWFDLKLRVPIIADVSVGVNLGDMYELEGIAFDTRYDFAKLWDEEKQEGLRVGRQRIPPNRGALEVKAPVFQHSATNR